VTLKVLCNLMCLKVPLNPNQPVRDATARDQRDVNHTAGGAGGGADGSVSIN